MRRLAVLALGVAASTLAAAEFDRSAWLALSASVLKIEARRVQGGYSLGSGVVVAPQTIITNCHVTRDASKVDVLRGGLRWETVSQVSDYDHDLCVLRVPGLQAQAVSLGRADRLRPGQQVTALGFTGGMGIQHSSGEVLALHRLDGSSVIRSTNWFTSGASGGGLFDEDMRLVGILTFRLRGGDAHYFAAPTEWVRKLLDAPRGTESGEPAPGHSRPHKVAFWQRPAHDQPRFLRAALLQRDGLWPELASLASEWVRSDGTDPEPWQLLGVALAQMDRLPEAQHAMACSQAIESASSGAAGTACEADAEAVPAR